MEANSQVIVLITYYDRELEKVYVSHGVDVYSGRNIIMPPEPLDNYKRMGATFNKDIGEWLLT